MSSRSETRSQVAVGYLNSMFYYPISSAFKYTFFFLFMGFLFYGRSPVFDFPFLFGCLKVCSGNAKKGPGLYFRDTREFGHFNEVEYKKDSSFSWLVGSLKCNTRCHRMWLSGLPYINFYCHTYMYTGWRSEKSADHAVSLEILCEFLGLNRFIVLADGDALHNHCGNDKKWDDYLVENSIVRSCLSY